MTFPGHGVRGLCVNLVCVQKWWEDFALNDGVAQVLWYRLALGLTK
jgi:hypothetical protein